MKRILLSGATAGTNFGDCLFAIMFQNEVAKVVGKENVYWYKNRFSISDYFKKQLNNYQEYKSIKQIDSLVYISGGYFCGDDRNWKDYLLRYLRYFSVGLKCILCRIPYIIVAVEVGPSKSKIIEFIEKIILRKAKTLIVRNHSSKIYAESFGCKNVIETADSVFAMDNAIFEDAELPQPLSTKGKKLFLHINPSIEQNRNIIEKIIPVVNRFIKQHPEYKIILGMDQYYSNQQQVIDYVKQNIENQVLVQGGVIYDNPLTLCKVLDNVDVIVTHKLHVGIVGAKLGKSVISFSGHTEKIQRLYDQLGIGNRTYPLKNLTTSKGLEMLEEFHNVNIKVPDNITNLAKTNFTYLLDFLK